MLGLLQPAPRSASKVIDGRGFDPTRFAPHALHDPARDWPQTNCYVDLWIELIAALGLPPEAMLGFTLVQDFEGDQFTFFKPPHADLEALYGVRVDELALYDDYGPQIDGQLRRDRVVLIEVDGFYLPDTRGVTYQIEHSKTTIGICAKDEAARRLVYFHNDGLFVLEGEDFDGVFGRLPHQQRADALFYYAEFARFDQLRFGAADHRAVAEELLARHFARRPERNPLHAFGEAFAELWRTIENRPPGFFHKFAFNTLRQLGANFELLGSHLDWLRASGAFAAEAEECRGISAGAKALQFQVARAASRRKPLAPTETIAELAARHDRLFDGLGKKLGA